MNFYYINLDSVSYNLWRRLNLVEYSLEGHKQEQNGGFELVFKFVRMDGVSRHLPEIFTLNKDLAFFLLYCCCTHILN